MLSVRIFRSCVVGHECFFKCWAIELVSERCIVSLLDRVVEVKPTYILLLSVIKLLLLLLYIYVGLTSTTLSRRLTMHLSDTSSIAQHLKKHSCPTTQLRKILTDNTTILEHQNNKQKLQILEALHIRNLQPTLNRINFQTSANVLKCL